MLTPKGLEVLDLVLRISLRRSSGVGCVRAVSYMERAQGLAGAEKDGQRERGCVWVSLTMPRPPASETADASSAADPLHTALDDGHWRSC